MLLQLNFCNFCITMLCPLSYAILYLWAALHLAFRYFLWYLPYYVKIILNHSLNIRQYVVLQLAYQAEYVSDYLIKH